ncbi:hypothetical protein CTI12_AA005230 [Artemisia annua]|uniref:Plant basic secretory protein (BSP) family protein n=1 Tax=Artemisia annua TaxID=35608 RepID=A0A2U1QNN9_ARTAN|nr:hypothetical protein CTI12_AA005230 [Artemisia annua]
MAPHCLFWYPLNLLIIYPRNLGRGVPKYDGAEAFTSGENINVSSLYLKGYQGDLKWEFTSLLYHEMTHVFQWNGEGQAPSANYYPPGFANPGDGDRWDQGYDITARFLEYCDGIIPQFVAKLNKMMRYSFKINYFEELTGKPVDQLWREYKAKYGH